MNRNQKLLLLSTGLVIVSWVVPILSLLTLPLQYLYTHLHEIGHAIVAAGTGGHDIEIKVFANGSGVTTSLGGSQLLISPAGYVGATVMGAVVLFLARTEQGARAALYGIAITLSIALAMWIRGDAVGLISAVVAIALLSLTARYIKGDALLATAQFFGIYQCLASLQAAFSIIGISSVALQENDAVILQHATGIPALLSSLLWATLSVAAVAVTVRSNWKTPS